MASNIVSPFVNGYMYLTSHASQFKVLLRIKEHQSAVDLDNYKTVTLYLISLPGESGTS